MAKFCTQFDDIELRCNCCISYDQFPNVVCLSVCLSVFYMSGKISTVAKMYVAISTMPYKIINECPSCMPGVHSVFVWNAVYTRNIAFKTRLKCRTIAWFSSSSSLPSSSLILSTLFSNFFVFFFFLVFLSFKYEYFCLSLSLVHFQVLKY